MNTNASYLHTLARILLALIFLVTGLTKSFDFARAAELIGQMGLPVPGFFLTGAILLEIVCGACLFFGYRTQWAALGLIGFLVPTTLLVHVSQLLDPAVAQAQLVEVLKNLSIIGGLLEVHLAASGDGSSTRADRPLPNKKTSDRTSTSRQYDVINSPYVTIR